jgi:large subunit ribosomal protein L18
MRLNKKEKRVIRNRSKLKKVNYSGIRVSVNKSQKNIFAQVINDNLNKTIVSASTLEKSFKSSKGKKTEMSVKLAEILAKRAIEKKITAAVFDRGGYKYHGIIKVFAETLRKQGMKI